MCDENETTAYSVNAASVHCSNSPELEGKRLVLQVENLNMLFSDMVDPNAGWCLRKTLQTEPQIMMVGSATSRFGEIDRPDRALYDLFRVLTLQPLDRNESAVLCGTVSGRDLDDGLVRRLQILTGGMSEIARDRGPVRGREVISYPPVRSARSG